MRTRFVAAAVVAGLVAREAAALDIKFTLDWAFQGPTSVFIAAKELGYYEEAGLDVTIDRGSGSAAAIQRIATGAYRMGIGDINALVEFNAANPGRAVKAVMVIYDAPPFGLYALAKSGIEELEDLVGRKLGAPVFDASYKLFPAFAAKVGIDPAALLRVNMDPPLREAMLVRGEVDVISGHYFSSMLDLQSKGVKADDIVVMLYKDYGMDFYGNSVLASSKFLAEQPEAVRKFNAATVRAMRWVMTNRDRAVDMVAKVDPLIDKKLERTRLDMALEMNVSTPHVREHGMGAVVPERLARSIAQIAQAVKLPTVPEVEDIWTDEFLPPPAERKLVN